MANGDITKVDEYDKIEVVGSWNIQVRKATKIMEENSDGSLTELSRGYHRHALTPFISTAYLRAGISNHPVLLGLPVVLPYSFPLSRRF